MSNILGVDDCREESALIQVRSSPWIAQIRNPGRIVEVDITLSDSATAGTYYVYVVDGMNAFDETNQTFKPGYQLKFPIKAITPGNSAGFASPTKWPSCEGLTVAISSTGFSGFTRANFAFNFYYHIVYNR